MNERNSIIGKIDWLTVLIYLALVIIGWFSIFSAKYDEMHPSIFDLSQVYGKQLIWIGASLLIGFVILLIDAKFFNAFSSASRAHRSRWFVGSSRIRTFGSSAASFASAARHR